jgi:hypothetical protein
MQSEHNRLRYFTQGVLYNFYSSKVKNNFSETVHELFYHNNTSYKINKLYI